MVPFEPIIHCVKAICSGLFRVYFVVALFRARKPRLHVLCSESYGRRRRDRLRFFQLAAQGEKQGRGNDE
jgi:hypothetical protein